MLSAKSTYQSIHHFSQRETAQERGGGPSARAGYLHLSVPRNETGKRGDRLRQPAQQCIEHVQTPLMTQAQFAVTMVTYGRVQHASRKKVLQCGGRTFNHKGCAERAGRKRRKAGSGTFSRSAAALATCLPVSHSRAGLELRRKGEARERGSRRRDAARLR